MKKYVIETANALFDLVNFLKYSFSENKLITKEHYVAFLSKQYHIIEKGLSLPNTKVGFGKLKIEKLIKELRVYISKFGEDELTNSIFATLNEYNIYSKANSHYTSLTEKIDEISRNKKFKKKYGGILKTAYNSSFNDYKSFVLNRRTLRDFEKEIIPKEILIEAVNIAKFTPSVCNRQGWKIHFYFDTEAKRMLSYQNGNTGFTDTINNLAIITGDISFFTANERNQITTDGGMFAMSFINSLHSLGIASCALNTCTSFKTEIRTKTNGNIKKNEKLIMFIAFGYPKKINKIAISRRRETVSFITFH